MICAIFPGADKKHLTSCFAPGKYFKFFSQDQLFSKIYFGIPSGCQTDWIQIKPDVLLGLIWVHVQSVYKSYEQTTLEINECFFYRSFLLLLFHVCLVMPSCLFPAVL